MEARRGVKWNLVGVDKVGNHLVEFRSNTDNRLHFYSLGVRSRDGQLNGSVRVDLSILGRGQPLVRALDCYKQFYPVAQVELFSLSEPQPEDRKFYWEFRAHH